MSKFAKAFKPKHEKPPYDRCRRNDSRKCILPCELEEECRKEKEEDEM